LCLLCHHLHQRVSPCARCCCRSSFFLAKTLTSTPIEVLQVTVFAVACYFMMGFQLSAAKFAVWWAVLVLFALASETLGYMAAIATPDSKVGVAVLSILLVFLLSFSGYLVSRLAGLKYTLRI
jgi:ATP-binding cassette subfamily G (WHITE) protein 1/ATP-binding cassette subfamily G (WHITE) protein 2